MIDPSASSRAKSPGIAYLVPPSSTNVAADRSGSLWYRRGTFPLRASLPITPLPGASGRPSSPRTVVSGPGCTVGPTFMCVLPFSTMSSPLAPDSDAPMASVRRTPGSRSRNCSLTEGEKMAAELLMASSDETSYDAPGAVRASTSGRAMASPVIDITFTCSRSTRRHASAASNLAVSTTLFPLNSAPRVPHWAAPCISGGIGNDAAPAPAAARSASSVGRSSFLPVNRSMPPPSVRKTSSWRHTTPLGMPVDPPV